MFKRLFRNIKKAFTYVFDKMTLEAFFLDSLILMACILIGKKRDEIVFFAVLMLAIIVAIKVYRKTFLDTFFSYHLLKEGKNNITLVIFATANIGALMYIIQEYIFGYIIFYTFNPVEFVMGLIILRLFLFLEEEYTQKWILLFMIEEINNLGEMKELPYLAKPSTKMALGFLDTIREGMVESVKEKMKSERMKTELITNISHDLKTPLTSIINYADILSKKNVMDEEAKNYINILGRNSNRLKTLIIDLIDASKTGTGNVRIEKGFIEFNELISQIYGDFDANFQEKNLELIYESDEENLTLYTDGNLVSRIIQNLLSNVYKYSMENTRVYSKTFTDGDKIYFNIKNISKKKLNMSADELIEQFIRGEKSRTTEGSGLGLHITRNLVEILGGEFRIIIDGDLFQAFVELPRGQEE